jgi:predicted transposase YdaD
MGEALSPPPIREFADHGIKWLLETPDHVRSLLRILAADLADCLDFSRLEPMKTDFIPDNLREQYADLVFLCPFRDAAGEREVVIVLLIEHQTEPDMTMPFRLLFYMVLIWDAQRRKWLDAKVPKSQWRFRPILPIVFHTGTDPWRASLDLAALMDLPEALHPFVPRHDTLLLSLEATEKARLVAGDRPFGWLMWLLKQAEVSLEEFIEVLREVMAHLEIIPDREHQAWVKAVYYLALIIYHRREEPDRSALLEVIQAGARERRQQEEIEEMGRTIAQALIEEGLQKGMREGEARGEARGALQRSQEILLSLLEEKFGTLSAQVHEQVKAIRDSERLSALIRRILTAHSLSDLGLAEG